MENRFLVHELVHEQEHLLVAGIGEAESVVRKAFHLVLATDSIHHTLHVQIPEIHEFQIRHSFQANGLYLLKMILPAQDQKAAMLNRFSLLA